MATARIWARKSVTLPHRLGGTYTVHDVQANESPRIILTRNNAAAFRLKQELNR